MSRPLFRLNNSLNRGQSSLAKYGTRSTKLKSFSPSKGPIQIWTPSTEKPQSLLNTYRAYTLPAKSYYRKLNFGISSAGLVTAFNATSRDKAKISPSFYTSNSILITDSQHISVDAALSWGVGLCINGRCLGWRFHQERRSELNRLGINWAELLAIELSIRYLVAAGATKSQLVIRSDNTRAIQWLNTRQCQNEQAALILDRIASISMEHGIRAHAEHVSGKENPADAPSRGRCSVEKLSYNFLLPSELASWMEHVVDYSQQQHL